MELSCFLVFNHFKTRFTFYDAAYYPDNKNLEHVYKWYHAERGWNRDFPTKFGERPRKIEYNKSLIAAFGDSFTYCAQVKDEETWEEYLSALLQSNVYNFGTSAYGTDQAYLKYLSVSPKVRTPVVLLGIYTENINRLLNVYRPFYFKQTGMKATKPRYILKQDKLVLLPNPVKSRDEIKNLQNIDFLRQIGRNDFWFKLDNLDKSDFWSNTDYPELKFPYVKILFNKRIWKEMINKRGDNRADDLMPRPHTDLWNNAEAQILMFKIIESFAADAKKYNSVPMIVILPSIREVKEKIVNGKSSEGEQKILEYCRAHHIIVFDCIELFAKQAGSVTEMESYFKGHVSPKGNKIIAAALYDFLNDSKLSLKAK